MLTNYNGVYDIMWHIVPLYVTKLNVRHATHARFLRIFDATGASITKHECAPPIHTSTQPFIPAE